MEWYGPKEEIESTYYMGNKVSTYVTQVFTVKKSIPPLNTLDTKYPLQPTFKKSNLNQ